MELDYCERILPTDRAECPAHRRMQEAFLKEWAGLLIPVLKASPSKERKFLRWKFSQIYSNPMELAVGAVRNRELEVLPETPPAI